MNESVVLAGELELMRNSLILIGLVLRTLSAVVWDCLSPLVWFVHEALPIRSPFKACSPEVTLNVALTLAPGATGAAKVFDTSLLPETKEVHCLPGKEMLNVTCVAGAPVVFVNFRVTSCEEPGANVCTPGGAAISDAGARVSGATSYLAATMLV